MGAKIFSDKSLARIPKTCEIEHKRVLRSRKDVSGMGRTWNLSLERLQLRRVVGLRIKSGGWMLNGMSVSGKSFGISWKNDFDG